MSAPSVVRCLRLEKTYTQGPQEVRVLRGVDLDVAAGDRIAIVGSSGSGKTTLLNLLGGLDLPTGGSVEVAGKDLAAMSEAERGRFRNRHLGFVYQFHHLLGEFSALENVCMPLWIAGAARADAADRSAAMLERVGLKDRQHHRPAELSGGERQRVAVARALVTGPRCVLLDEPTGNLDRRTALEVQDLILALNAAEATSLVAVTHDERLADSMRRKLLLKDGALHE